MLMLLPTLLTVEDSRGAAAVASLLFHEIGTQEFGTTAAPTEHVPHFEIRIAGAPVKKTSATTGRRAKTR